MRRRMGSLSLRLCNGSSNHRMAVTLPLIVFALLFLIGARRSGISVAFVLAALWWGH